MATGSYAPADSAGIKIYAFDLSTGEATLTASAKGVSNPSYVAFCPSTSQLYAVGEDAGHSSTVNRLRADIPAGELTLEQSLPSLGGAPCFIAVAPDGSSVGVANYNGGSVTFYPLDAKGSMLEPPVHIAFSGRGPDSLRQTQPRLHQVLYSPDGRTIFANDLGTDRIHIITLPADSSGAPAFKDFAVEPGAGPRHTAFSPDGSNLYTLSEISGKIFAFGIRGDSLQLIQTVEADPLHAEGSADIHVSPDGRFVYASNRLKGDGLVTFAIDQENGLLRRTGFTPTGPHPRNFAITPDGRWILVACRDSDSIEVYSRDTTSGELTRVNEIAVSKPTCIAFLTH